MDKPQSNLLFIDRVNFINLQDSKFNLEDLRKEILGDNKFHSTNGNTVNSRSELLSPLTIAIISSFNEILNKSLFDGYFFRMIESDVYRLLSVKDREYALHYVKDYLTNKRSDNCSESPALVSNTKVNKKYYELIPLLNNDVLVVLEEAFFDITTESKDNLNEFVLDCLSFQYKFSLDYRPLMKLYLKLRMNDNALNMLKLRFN